MLLVVLFNPFVKKVQKFELINYVYTINAQAKVVAQDLKNRREDLTIQPKAIIYYVKISQRKFRKQSQVQVNRSC